MSITWLIRTISNQMTEALVGNANSTSGQLITLYTQFLMYSLMALMITFICLKMLKIVSGTDLKIKGTTISNRLYSWWLDFGVLLGIPRMIDLIYGRTVGIFAIDKPRWTRMIVSISMFIAMILFLGMNIPESHPEYDEFSQVCWTSTTVRQVAILKLALDHASEAEKQAVREIRTLILDL